MESRNNFVSVVVLGNFNPAIMTPDFVRDVCRVDLGDPEQWSPPPAFARIVMQIKYKQIQLFVDFDRLQIKQEAVENLDRVRGTEVMKKYLSALPYTPLTAAGINFNCSFTPEDGEIINPQKIFDANPEELLALANSGELLLEKKALHIKGSTTPLNLNITFPLQAKRKMVVSLQFEADKVTMNFNYEVSNLSETPKDFAVLDDEYQEILSKFRRMEHSVKERILT